jgi:hypothetical protein
MRLIRVARTVVFVSIAVPAAVLAQQGQDELWDTSMSMQSDGMKMPAMTQQVCTPKGRREDRLQMDKNCKMVESKQSGNKFTFKVVCTEGRDSYTGTGEMEDLGKDAYRGFMTATGTRDGEKFNMRMDMSGKRVGNCTWEDPTKKVAAIEKQQKDMMAKECDRMIAELEPAMVFGYEGLPPEAVVCRDRQADFCANTGKVVKGIRDRASWDATRDKYGREKLASATKACKLDLATVRAPLCKDAQDKQDWNWFGGNCPEAAALRKQHCAGRTYSSVEPKHASMCAALGGLSYTAATADPAKAQAGGAAAASQAGAQGSAASQPGAQGSQGGTAGQSADAQKKPSSVDKLKEGADKLKKFLKF